MTSNQDKTSLDDNITTQSAKFDDIRHFRDDEVPEAIQSILNDDTLIDGISSYMFKRYPPFIDYTRRTASGCTFYGRYY